MVGKKCADGADDVVRGWLGRVLDSSMGQKRCV